MLLPLLKREQRAEALCESLQAQELFAERSRLTPVRHGRSNAPATDSIKACRAQTAAASLPPPAAARRPPPPQLRRHSLLCVLQPWHAAAAGAETPTGESGSAAGAETGGGESAAAAATGGGESAA